MPADANKLERIQQKFASVCFYRFFFLLLMFSIVNAVALDKLGLQSLRKKRHYLDELFCCSGLSWP
jgi:hypothetical protein